MQKILITILATLVLSISVTAQQSLTTFVNAPNLKRANISLMVKEVHTGQVVMEHRADKLTTPASTTKLLTTGTALDILGPDFRFKTNLEYDGKIENGTLNGNLYIKGGGDPTLGSGWAGDSLFLDKWVEAVKKQGIRKITGAIIADATLFDPKDNISPQWANDDIGNYYAAGIYGISIYDNIVKAIFKSGKAGTTPKLLRTQPNTPEMKYTLKLKAANVSGDYAYFSGQPLSYSRVVTGSIPVNQDEFASKGDMPNPPLYAAQVFAKKLRESGIEIQQEATTKLPPLKLRCLFYTQQSPPLKEIISVINHRSNNHYTEHLFRYLSLQKDSVGNINGAVEVIKNHWKSKGLDVDGFTIYDGCGLAPANNISAKFFVDLLTYEATKSLYSKEFLASLPYSGQPETTLKNLLKGTALEGKVYAKSGSINGVQCYAGYIFLDKKQYAFAILVNNFTGARANVVKEMEKLLLSVE